jgi:hypothetical protein
MLNLKEVIAHVRRPYMSGIDRSADRVNASHEFFTPTDMLIKINDWLDLYDESLFTVSTKKFLDHSCGDGQILTEVLIRKLESLGKEEITDIEFEQALSTIYGVELMIDNVDLCRERLLCGSKDPAHIAIVTRQIVCYNSLDYDYKFARRKTKEIKHEISERKEAERAKKKAEIEKAEQEVIAKRVALFNTAKAKKKL